MSHEGTDLADGQPHRPDVHAALLMLKSAQKPSAGTPLYSRFINRPLGRVFAALAIRVGMGPNTVSLVSATFSMTGIAAIAFGSPSASLGVFVSTFLVLGYALDSADGQVARTTGRGSVAGEWLDHILDAVKITSLHAAVCWSAVRNSDSDVPVAIALGFGVVAVVMFFGMILTDQLRRAANVPKAAPRSSSSDLVRAIAVVPSDFGALCMAFLLFGLPQAFFTVYALLGAGSAALLGVALRSWWRQLNSIDTRTKVRS